jgi:hypothetical protein
MTAAQLAARTELRRGLVTGKPPRPAARARWPKEKSARSGPSRC